MPKFHWTSDMNAAYFKALELFIDHSKTRNKSNQQIAQYISNETGKRVTARQVASHHVILRRKEAHQASKISWTPELDRFFLKVVDSYRKTCLESNKKENARERNQIIVQNITKRTGFRVSLDVVSVHYHVLLKQKNSERAAIENSSKSVASLSESESFFKQKIFLDDIESVSESEKGAQIHQLPKNEILSVSLNLCQEQLLTSESGNKRVQQFGSMFSGSVFNNKTLQTSNGSAFTWLKKR